MIFLIDMNVEESTAEEIQRVIQACQLKTHEYELVNQIWDYALKDHYEYSYMADYVKHLRDWVEETLEDDFEALANFFMDEAEDFGVPNISPEDKLGLSFDWSANKITIEGNLNVLEAAILACLRGYGMFWYESYADFKEAHGSETQQERILSNFGCLKHLESIYDSSQRFFIMKDTDNLEKYYLLGNFEVTDEDLKNAYSCIIG